MGSKTRYFLVGSALVVLIGLGVGLVAYYGGDLMGRSARSDFAYVPQGAKGLGYVNVRDIMNSPFRQRLRTLMPAGEGRGEFLKDTGIDLEKDIDSVLTGMLGVGDEGGAVAILRGRFDRAKIEQLAADRGAISSTYKSATLWTADTDRTGSLGIAFLEPGVLGLGSAAGLKRAIDAAEGRSDVTGDTELMKAVSDIERSGNAWFVTRMEALPETEHLPDTVTRHLSKLTWLAVGADVGENVRARVRAEALDDQAAEDIRSVVNGALSAVRMFSGDNERLAALLKSLQTSGQGRSIELTFSAPADIVDGLGVGHAGSPTAPPAAPAPPVAPER